MLAQAWRLDRDRVRKRKAKKRVREQGSHSERCPMAGVIKLPLTGFWDSVGDKEDPADLPERNPATRLRGKVWL